ncbi:VacJ family lipoprotein [Sphingomonadaceae bacterium jetA1]|jgi:phospholipid-binding lipoprotein MlaA|uniref:MlaA family lipoprotein n=1 Tax=Facivitalis istanbulensis TaxID=3075838 RepID=UPI0034699E6F
MILLSLAALLAAEIPAGQWEPPSPSALATQEDAVVLSSSPSAAVTPPQEAAPAEIVVTASKFRPGDPLAAMNEASFALTQRADDAVMAPAAQAYRKVAPRRVRTGLRNFFNNLREPVVFANFLLQLKFGKAAETVGRFAINSTIGLLGFHDAAGRCPFRLPWRPNGFSDTLGFYGVGQGPFLFVPLLGPTTIRDIVGGVVDGVVMPVAIGGPFRNRAYLIGSGVIRVLDRRVEMDAELRDIRASDHPYSERRDRYLRRRAERLERLKGQGDAGTAPPPAGAYAASAAGNPVVPIESCARRADRPASRSGS